MTAEQYKMAVKARGTQQEVATRLGVDRSTIIRRVSGDIEITREAELALLSLPTKRKPRKAP